MPGMTNTQNVSSPYIIAAWASAPHIESFHLELIINNTSEIKNASFRGSKTAVFGNSGPGLNYYKYNPKT